MAELYNVEPDNWIPVFKNNQKQQIKNILNKEHDKLTISQEKTYQPTGSIMYDEIIICKEAFQEIKETMFKIKKEIK